MTNSSDMTCFANFMGEICCNIVLICTIYLPKQRLLMYCGHYLGLSEVKIIVIQKLCIFLHIV